MTSTEQPKDKAAERLGAAELLAAVADVRSSWLAAATSVLAANPLVASVWLVGSLGRNEGDGFSDVDLIVAVDQPVPDSFQTSPFAGLGLPGTVLFERPKPRNAPADGAYRALCLDLGGLPVLTDLYLWPAATAAVPAGAQVLLERTVLTRSDLAFMPLLDRHRTPDPTGADPTAAETTLMLIQLAAKYHARADTARLAGIAGQLGLPPDPDVLLLRQTLHQRGAPGRDQPLQDAFAAVGELLTLADEHGRPLTGDRADGEPR